MHEFCEYLNFDEEIDLDSYLEDINQLDFSSPNSDGLQYAYPIVLQIVNDSFNECK